MQLAGGLPVLLPPLQRGSGQILETIEGLIFSSGGDLSPSLYGGSPQPSIYLVDEERDNFELALAKAAFTANVPVLGIGRGMQILSVEIGAELIPHVPDGVTSEFGKNRTLESSGDWRSA